MSLETPSKIRMLQRKLYLKAKAEPNYRFYLRYDKIYREDVFAHAYELVKANQGAPGVDGQTFEQIRVARAGGVAGRHQERASREDIQTTTGAEGDDPEAGRRGKAARYSFYKGSSGTDRCQADAGADL
jgi:hypothetical protein